MELTLYSNVIAVVVVAFYLVAIACAIEAMQQARTSQGASAWVISLLTIPYAAVPLYMVFGRNRFHGYLAQRSHVEAASQQLISRTRESIEDHLIPRSSDNTLFTSLYQLARIPPTDGNEVELLCNGEQTFDSIAEGLATARNYILFQFYIIRDDELGQRLGRILMDKARAGVKVFLLYDEIGSRAFQRSKLLKQLRTVGVQVAAFNTTQGRRRNRFQLNFRNHRKIIVVDGQTAWIGGHNVGTEYLGKKKRIGHWRDTHTRLCGPAVNGAELTFACDWYWATRSDIDISWQSSFASKGESEVLVFPSDPASEFEEAGLMYHQVIVDARKRIWIASPYFVPDRAIISALQLASLRGVDVRVIIPDNPDGPIVGLANWAYTKELLPAGVRVYRYRDGFMHQKVFLMDDQVAGVGTANFDNRSFRLNFEVTLLVNDENFATEVYKMLEADMAQSKLVELSELKDKPAWFHLAMGAARLMAPVL